MRTMKLGKTNLTVPVMALGCMRLAGADRKQAAEFIDTAMGLGLNFFDHADIYGGGKCETVFADLIREAGITRDKLLIQSKCGIVPGKMFDFSKEHIINSVDKILTRLGTDYLDVLLLHRPDALMEPDEVAEAFNILEDSGKVRHFGVSNQDPYTMELLQRSLRQPLAANQLQLSITNATMISQPMNTNISDAKDPVLDNGVMNYCRLNNITIQPWSPFQYGMFEGTFMGNTEKFPKLNAKLDELAEKYGVANTTIAMAWLLRHPAKLQPVTGTINPKRIVDCAKAADITLTREEWYSIYLAAGYRLP